MDLGNVIRKVRQSLRERPHNLLCISDLHLGCDLKAPGQRGADAQRHGVLDLELATFLDWHADHLRDGKPWRLILNGDIVDFVAITRTPAEGEAPFSVTDEERLYGLAPEEDKCVWKLRQVSERHAAVFDALARFLQKGNSIHIVRGNHDSEFHFPGVQEEWKRILLDRAGVRGGQRRRLERNVQFHPWFYLEPGFFYAEHGNAYDRYSVQTGFFAPSGVPGGELDLPLSSLVLRYFVNKYAEQEDLDHADSWGVKEYLQWTFRAGNPLRIAADYFMMVWRVVYPVARESLRFSRAAARAAEDALAKMDGTDASAHVRRLLRKFAEGSDTQAQKLLAITSRPAEQSLFDAAQLFYLDRMVLAGISLLGSWGAVTAAPTIAAKLAACGLFGIAFAAVNAWLSRCRQTDSHPMLLQAARRVAEVFDVRYVVMGHSHRPVSEDIRPGTRYFNLGSWTSPREGFPHLVVTPEGAELRRWRAAPAPAAATAPAAVPAKVVLAV